MRDITSLTNKYNNIEDEKNSKIPLKKKATLIFHSRSNITTKERRFQIRGRMTLTALATAMMVSGGVIANNISSNHNQQEKYNQSSELLDKDEVLNEAYNALFDCVYGEKRKNIEEPLVKYINDDSPSGKIIAVSCIKANGRETDFTYRSNLVSKNSREINNFLKELVYIKDIDELGKSISQEDLKKLVDAIDELDDKNYKLERGSIVEVKENDRGYER